VRGKNLAFCRSNPFSRERGGDIGRMKGYGEAMLRVCLGRTRLNGKRRKTVENANIDKTYGGK